MILPRSALVLAALASLAACAPVGPVGPDYTQPNVPLTASFAGQPTAAATLDAAWAKWWQGYNDPILNQLVEQALAQNLDIAASLARVDAAEAGLRATGLNAQVNGSLSGQRTRSGGDLQPVTEANSASLNASYVLDLFGGTRRSQEQATADRDAALADVGTARLAMLTALIGAYVDVRYFQEAITLTRSTIASRERTLGLVRAQGEVGSASELDIARAQSALDGARASLPSLESGFDSSVFAIATLLAQPAEPLRRSLSQGSAQPRAKGGSSLGTPIDLLRVRPDLRAAERRFASAVAAVGIAASALYPSVTLSGSLSERSNTTWSFGPQLSVPLLNRGALAARRDQAMASAAAQEQLWRSAVLRAVENVQSNESLYRARRAEAATLSDVVASSQKVIDLSRASYELGETSLLDLLDAERSYTDARLSLAQAIRGQATAWAQLQIALGRGSSIVP
jgi:multidrug efflux system outer membrane protein